MTPVPITESLVDTNSGRGGEAAIRPHAADAVPGVLRVRGLAFTLVALEEAGHEELAGQRGQLDAAGLAITHDLVLVVEVHYLDHGARLRRVVGDFVVVVRTAGCAGGQAHQRVAIGGR